MVPNSEGINIADLSNKNELKKIGEFWIKHGVSDLKYIESSHMNLSWFGKIQDQEVVCQMGPSTPDVLSKPGWSDLTTKYFSPHKYDFAKGVCDFANSINVPCPQIVLSGEFENKAWSVAKKAKGIGLDNIWDNLSVDKQKSVIFQLGGYLGHLHSKGIDKSLNPGEWYMAKIFGVLGNLILSGVYSKKELIPIKNILMDKFEQVMPSALTLTHNDILQKNVLVNPETLEITSIIDWETSAFGDPKSDLLLGAWWFSGEYGGNEELYKAMLEGYNHKASEKELKIFYDEAKKLNPYMDMLWYLNILWIRKIMGDDSQTERRKGMVEKIVNELK